MQADAAPGDKLRRREAPTICSGPDLPSVLLDAPRELEADRALEQPLLQT